MGAVVGAAGRDVDRHVPDQAHAALPRVATQSPPFAVEAQLLLGGALACEALPVLEPVALALAEGGELALGHRRVRVGEQLAGGGERRRRFVRRAALARRTQR